MKLVREERSINRVWQTDQTDKMCDLHPSSKAASTGGVNFHRYRGGNITLAERTLVVVELYSMQSCRKMQHSVDDIELKSDCLNKLGSFHSLD